MAQRAEERGCELVEVAGLAARDEMVPLFANDGFGGVLRGTSGVVMRFHVMGTRQWHVVRKQQQQGQMALKSSQYRRHYQCRRR